MTNNTLTTRTLTAEASDLNFPVGRWPESFRYGVNNVLFERVSIERDEDGDIVAVHYAFGTTKMVVFND